MTPAGNAFMPDTIDRGQRLFYDKQTAAAGATVNTLAYFGHSIAGSGKHVTNLQQANRMPPPEAFSVMCLGWRISPLMLPADWINMVNNFFWELVIGRKIIMEGLLDQYPGGTGMSGFASTNHATTALVQSINNGAPDVRSQREFGTYPRIIPAEVNFEVDLKLGGTAVVLVAAVASTVISPAYGGLDLRCDLDGVFDAPVQ